MTPRGIRGNNPGNVRKDGTVWQGMAEQQTDPSFIVFKAPVWGIRALVKVLDTYQHTHGLWTIRQMISRWAPPNENDTESYIRAVSDACHVSPDVQFPLNWPQHIRDMVKAIITHENGEQPYADSVIDQAVSLARGN